MVFKNNKGLTLVEVLAALSISIMILGLVTTVLIQSFRNAEISDSHLNLRQEANLIITAISAAHEKNNYDIIYTTNELGDWVLMIGEIKIQSHYFDLELIINNAKEDGTSRVLHFNTNLTDPDDIEDFHVFVRNPLHVQKLKLTSKEEPTKSFEISTMISRL